MKMRSYILKQKDISADEAALLAYLKILADLSKYKIIRHLRRGEECVCVLAEKVGLEQTLASHHLRLLRQAGFVKRRKVGTWVHYSLNKAKFVEVEGLYQQLVGSEGIGTKDFIAVEACEKRRMEAK